MNSSCGKSRAERREIANHSQDAEPLERPALGKGRVGHSLRVEGGADYETGHWLEGQAGPHLTGWAAALGWQLRFLLHPLLGLVWAKVDLLGAL